MNQNQYDSQINDAKLIFDNIRIHWKKNKGRYRQIIRRERVRNSK